MKRRGTLSFFLLRREIGGAGQAEQKSRLTVPSLRPAADFREKNARDKRIESAECTFS